MYYITSGVHLITGNPENYGNPWKPPQNVNNGENYGNPVKTMETPREIMETPQEIMETPQEIMETPRKSWKPL